MSWGSEGVRISVNVQIPPIFVLGIGWCIVVVVSCADSSYRTT